jgi:hypothetical protein
MATCARVCLGLVIGAAGLHAVPAGAASSIACNSSGLKTQHGASRNHVRALRAKGTTCATARKVAKDYAQGFADAGPGEEVPSKVDGYDVNFVLCDDNEQVCPNSDNIVARRGSKRITFVLVYD